MATATVIHPAVAVAAVLAAPHLTFKEKVKAEFAHLFGHVPSYAAIATSTITYVAPLVETALTFIDPVAGAASVALVGKVQGALAAANVVIKDAGPAPTVLTYLNAVQGNLQQLLTAADLKNPDEKDKYTTLITALTQEVTGLIQEIDLGSTTALAPVSA